MPVGGEGVLDEGERHAALDLVLPVLGPGDIAYVTRELDLVWVSDSFTTVLGWEPHEVLGHPAVTLLSPDQDMTWVDAHRHRLLSGKDAARRVLVRAKDGTDRWFSAVAHPVNSDGGVTGFAVILHDVTVALDLAAEGPYIDEVTGLWNRGAVLRQLDVELTERRSRLCVLVVEFTNLTVVNESLGHEAGDRALAIFAQRLRDSFPGGECMGRISGRTFLVCCPHDESMDSAGVASSLVATWQAEMLVEGRRIEPEIRAAVVEPELGATSLTALRDADVTLAQARNGDGRAVTVHSSEMSALATRRFVLEDELRYALDAEEFELFFQPIVALGDRSVVAAEALVRWRHPREGLLAPPSFLPIAEESRLIRPLGHVVVSQALEALRQLPDHSLQIGVNVSAVELRDTGWRQSLEEAIDRSGVDPCCLVIELTETAVLSAKRDLADDLAALRQRGIAVFLDDFGTGYSSLSLLRDLPVSGIKLDKSFVSAVDSDDEFAVALSRGIVDLIRPLELAGVAEGIETERQATRLHELGWEFGQGYFFGRPGPFSSLPPVPARPLGTPPG